jgi:carbon monoxide dehydrogenase subunit G
MLIDGRFEVAAAPAAVLAHLFDARLMASCVPGCESLEPSGDDRYRAVVAVALAGVKARFDLQVEVTERLADGVRASIRGEEGGNASTLQAASEVHLSPSANGGTQVDYRSDVTLTGRLGRFALGMMKKKAQSLGDEFAANLQRALAAEPPTATAAAPVSAAAAPTAAAPTPAPSEAVAQPAATASPAAAMAPVPPAAPEARAPASAWQRFVHWLRSLFGRASHKHP